MFAGRVLIYGGRGALGATCVSHFKASNWWVGSVDLTENAEAHASIVLGKNDTIEEQERTVLSKVEEVLGQDNKLDAVICVAGGWAGGNAKADLIKNSDLMWRQSVWSSLISTAVAARFLKEGGLLTLTGAKAALGSTSGMIGYGMAKAAVHHLTQSLAKDGGLPADAAALAILPVTLDTPMNRKWMPDADHSTWTPLSFVAQTFMDWTDGKKRPASGSLVQLVTKNSETELIVA